MSGRSLPTLALVIAVYAAAGLSAMTSPASEALAKLDATDISGRRWTAEAIRGRVVLLDFWATWCAPCLSDLPGLKKVYQRHSQSDFEIIGVSLDVSSRRTFVSWLNRNRIEWPQIHEQGGYSASIARLFGVDRLPRTVLVDRDGSVIATDLRGNELIERIEGLIGRTSPQAAGRRMGAPR